MSLYDRDVALINKTNADQAVPHPNDAAKDSNVERLVEGFAAQRRASARIDRSQDLRQINVNLAARILSVDAPRSWLEPDAEDMRDIATYMLAVAKVCDQWANEVGVLVGASKDGMKLFTSPFVGAIDGNATHVIEELARDIEDPL